MKYFALLTPLLLLIPNGAAGVAYAQSTTNSSTAASSTQILNQYVAAQDVSITNPPPADIIAGGATVSISAPVHGDVLAAGGTVEVTKGASGDVRVAGLKVLVDGPVTGDIAAAGGTVHVSGSARTIYAAGASVDVHASSTGNVTIYGANVTLSGNIAGNVVVVASNQFALADGTHIQGSLKYSAPEQLSIAPGVQIDGGARYTGAYAYVPTNKQVHRYALLGTALFFIIRILAGSIVAGLILGLFPRFAEPVTDMALSRSWVELLRYVLIGLGIAIATPILSLLLLFSFVGFGLALFLMVSYTLLALLAYAFSGIILGIFLRHIVLYKLYGGNEPLWQDAVFGTFLVHLLGLIPYIGTILVFLITLLCAGALFVFMYRFAFGTYTKYS